MYKTALCLAIATVLAACSSTDTKQDVPVKDASNTQTGVPTQGGRDTTPLPPTKVVDPLTDPNNVLYKRSVFFDFDSNAVKDEFRPVVQAHSKFMTNEKREAKIRIEGNCDERGSREYNLALGQRRAEAVKKVMTVLGVQDGRIETTSYGEEKPKAPGHDEGAWAQNRRADIKYPGE